MPFTPQAVTFLKSLSHQPWGLSSTGAVRVLSPHSIGFNYVCPVCMGANIKSKDWRFHGAAHTATAVAELALSTTDVNMIMDAADKPTNPNRAELIKLLGGIRTKENYNPETKEYRPDATN